MKQLKYFVVTLAVLLLGLSGLAQVQAAGPDGDDPGACPAGQVPSVSYETDFSDGGVGWTTATSNTSPTGETAPWVITTTNPSTISSPSGGNAYFVADIEPANNDGFISSLLVSPPVTVPTGTGEITLQFWNRKEFEIPTDDGTGNIVCWDSGILEVSSDGGSSWTQVPNSAMVNDPYDLVVYSDPDYHHPFAGQPAWCPPTPNIFGNGFEDWMNTVVDVSAWAGQEVQFRWHFGTDSFAPGYGWHVDDVKVQACVAGPPTAVTLNRLDSRRELPILPFAALGLLGLAGLAVLRRHKRA